MNGEISLPVENRYGQKYPIIQYVDGTLLIMPADKNQLMPLKSLLHFFSMSIGLLVNYSISSIVPINIDNATALDHVDNFGCRVESLPFTYLVLPLGTTKPSVHDLVPIRIDKRLSGVVASTPIFAMCTFKVHYTIIDHVNKASRNFLWYGKRHKQERKLPCKLENDL